jgi:hypothetical protein
MKGLLAAAPAESYAGVGGILKQFFRYRQS